MALFFYLFSGLLRQIGKQGTVTGVALAAKTGTGQQLFSGNPVLNLGMPVDSHS